MVDDPSSQISVSARNRVIDCIDYALDRLGQGIKSRVYRIARKQLGVEVFEMLGDKEKLDYCMKQVVGEENSKMAEEHMLNHLRARFNPPFHKNVTVPEALDQCYEIALSEEQGRLLLMSGRRVFV